MDDYTRGFNGGYQCAMRALNIILGNMLDEIREEEVNSSCSKTLEYAKDKIKFNQEFCLKEYLEKKGLNDGNC